MSQTRIAILGGGNNGPTMAADLALQGAAVNLFDFPTHDEAFGHILATRTIEKYGSTGTTGPVGTARLNIVTTNLKEAIKDAELIFIAVPAYAHMAFFQPLANLLEDGQHVIVTPGNWGGLRLSRLLSEGGRSRVAVAETDVCTQICRHAEPFTGPGRVRVILERARIRVAAATSPETEKFVTMLQRFYPQIVPARSFIETSLRNDNVVIHGPLMLMNAGWLEHTSGNFMIYRDGVTPAVARMMDAVRRERESVIAELGLETISAPAEGETYSRYHNAQWVHDPCEIGPPRMTHRYLSEDVPFGLVPIQQLARVFGIDTPSTQAIVSMASIVNGVDYSENGLRLEDIGLPTKAAALRSLACGQ